jgi:hypothetical protein
LLPDAHLSPASEVKRDKLRFSELELLTQLHYVGRPTSAFEGLHLCPETR